MHKLITELFFTFYRDHMSRIIDQYAGVVGAPVNRQEIFGELWVQYMADVESIEKSMSTASNPHVTCIRSYAT